MTWVRAHQRRAPGVFAPSRRGDDGFDFSAEALAALGRAEGEADARARLHGAIRAADEGGEPAVARSLRRELAQLELTRAGRLHGPAEVAALVGSALVAADASDDVLDALAVTLHPISNREEAA